MEMMRWYNPVTKQEKDVPIPAFDAQAMEMLSNHRESDRFIEEYRRLRAKKTDIVKALILTGETFYLEHQKGQSLG